MNEPAVAEVVERVWLIGGREYRVVKSPSRYARVLMHGQPPKDAEPLEKIRHVLGEVQIVLADADGNPPPQHALENDLDVEEIPAIRRAWGAAPFDLSPDQIRESMDYLDEQIAKAAKRLPWQGRLRVWALRKVLYRKFR
jgi:hypothetical protein